MANPKPLIKVFYNAYKASKASNTTPSPHTEELRRQWIADLRSGEFKQGRCSLQSPCNSYCCLGVAVRTAERVLPNYIARTSTRNHGQLIGGFLIDYSARDAKNYQIVYETLAADGISLSKEGCKKAVEKFPSLSAKLYYTFFDRIKETPEDPYFQDLEFEELNDTWGLTFEEIAYLTECAFFNQTME